MASVGIDTCKGGWIAVALRSGVPPRAVQSATLAGISCEIGDAEMFGVDIPIGLSTRGPREADLAARARLGPRWPSVFLTPIREALSAPTYAEATAIAVTATGKGISRQAFALAPKIFEAEQWAARHPERVREVHPELSFAEMLGRPAGAAKKTWSGMRERLTALARSGIVLEDLVGTGAAGVDDVLDAAAGAWSAARILRGEAVSIPDPPELDVQSGRAIAIWA